PSRTIFERVLAKKRGERVPRKYKKLLKQFALTLDFLSPKAYRYVRRVFLSALPHPKTICNWYKNVQADPGFTKECLDTLKALVEKENLQNKKVVCQLVFDEIHIFSGVQKIGKKTYGYSTINTAAKSLNTQATQILLFMVVDVNGKWKLPIGYFPINSLTADLKSNLIVKAVSHVQETGTKLIGVTFDGAAVNFSAMNNLGACFDMESLISTIRINPDNKALPESMLYVFPDPCHMIKLIRNVFGEKEPFYDMDGNQINFKYIEELLKIHEESGLHLGNKLKRIHVYFKKKKMNVRIAVQLLSKSVADAIDYCRDVLQFPEFVGSEATSKFIRMMNDIFDVLNSRNRSDFGWKGAIWAENFSNVEEFCAIAKTYISNLHFRSKIQRKNVNCQTSGSVPLTNFKKKPLICSASKIGFLGLYICLENLPKIFSDYKNDLNPIGLKTYNLNQDSVELFFNSVRSRLGCNTSPTVLQFRAAYRKLITYAQIKEDSSGNCIAGLENVKILQVNPERCIQAINNVTVGHTEKILMPKFKDEMEFEEIIESQRAISIFSEEELTEHSTSQSVSEELPVLSEVQKSVICYIAGCIISI
uniref:THAP-type domain-containing protein n=1 Tax=Phlebotomus papatasi TaxID=29031 RepID=A0A1B0DHA7_PHLPP